MGLGGALSAQFGWRWAFAGMAMLHRAGFPVLDIVKTVTAGLLAWFVTWQFTGDAHDLIRLSAVCAVAYGRDWLANDFLPQLLRERAPDGLIVHGPVVMFVDESATRRYARSQRGTVR